MKKRKCDICGEYHDVINYIDNLELYVCETCENENLLICEDCGEWEYVDDAIYIEDANKYVCDNCSSNYYYCADCGHYYSEGYSVNNGDFYVCDNCSYDYYYCDECGGRFTSDYIHTNNDYYYCDECYEENSGGIMGYHEFDNWQFFKNDDEEVPSYYIGAEIEIEPLGFEYQSGSTDEILENMKKNINAVAMSDSSLKSGGFEVVNHPQTWKYYEKHKENYKNFFESVNHHNFGNDGHTGLHFHITRPKKEVIARIILMLENFKDEIKILSRRSEYNLNSWAKFLSDDYGSSTDNLKYKSKKYLEEEYLNSGHGRYMALNLTNANTIEFRFFDGVNSFDEFWSSLQFIKNLVDIALDESKDITSITWSDLIIGDELIEEVKRLDLDNIDKKVIDTTEMLEKIKKAQEEVIKNTKRILANLLKTINNNITKLAVENSKLTKKELLELKGKTNELYRELEYMNNITNLYHSITSTTSISNIKENIAFGWYRSNKKYERYFKQINDIIKKNELKEVSR